MPTFGSVPPHDQRRVIARRLWNPLPTFVDFFNRRRPQAISGRSPFDVVNKGLWSPQLGRALQIGDWGTIIWAAVAAAWPLRVTTIAPSVTRNTRLVLVGHADGAPEVAVEGDHRTNLGLVDDVVRVGQPPALVSSRQAP